MTGASIYDPAAMTALARACGVNPQALRQVRNAFLKNGLAPAAALACLPETVRPRLAESARFHFLALGERRDSDRDGASKLLFVAADGQRLESVILRIRSGRTSLCVSTQAGCAGGCRFCATGAQGLARDLTTDEILDQVAWANQLLHPEGRLVRNVVFMGMGEPFHNEANVTAAVARLIAPDGFHLSDRKLTVSTLGIPEAMLRFAQRFPRVRLAVSLHSARQEVREQLMPLARRHPLVELRAAMAQVAALQGQPVMIEYLLLAGVNDEPADVAALQLFLTGLPVHLNLIPYNPAAAAPGFRPTPEPHRRALAAALRAAGFTVTLRHSLGDDIAAACGQLANGGDTYGRPAGHPHPTDR